MSRGASYSKSMKVGFIYCIMSNELIWMQIVGMWEDIHFTIEHGLLSRSI